MLFKKYSKFILYVLMNTISNSSQLNKCYPLFWGLKSCDYYFELNIGLNLQTC